MSAFLGYKTASGRPVLLAYANALLTVVLALLVRILLERVIGYHHPYVTFYLATLWAAWYGGLGPALLSIAVGAVTAVYLLTPAVWLPGPEVGTLDLDFYLIVSISAALLIESLHRAKQRADRNADMAQQRLEELARETADRIRAEERLREKQKLESIGLLAAGVAHDFNNLLTGILGNAALAAQGFAPGEAARHYLEAIVAGAERAAGLTRQLLAYAGKGQVLVREVSLSALVRDAVDLIRPSLPENAALRLELADPLPPVQGDPVQLEQLVSNLITNAVEAIDDDAAGDVVVSTGAIEVEPKALPEPAVGELEPGRYVYVTIRDTGAGIPEDIVQRIFEPFFSTKFLGRGLGLAAVSGIVRSYRGALTVKTAPGQGSEFTVYLPVARDQPKQPLPASTPQTTAEA